MDPITLALLGLGAGGLGAGAALWTRRATKRAWSGIARDLGLTHQDTPRPRGARLWGLRRGVPVAISDLGRGRAQVAAFFSMPLPPGVVARPEGQSWPEVPPDSTESHHPGIAFWNPPGVYSRCSALLRHSVVRAALDRLLATGLPFTLTSDALLGRVSLSPRQPKALARFVDDLVEEVLGVESGLSVQFHEGRGPSAVSGDPAGGTGAAILASPAQGTGAISTGAAADEGCDAAGAVVQEGGRSDGATIDSIVAELAREGTLDSEGEFTLDAATAREKMRRFQMENPWSFALLLASAALLRGAKKLSIELGRHFRMTFDGTPITRAEVDRVWSSLFTTKGTRADRSLRHLGLGLHWALGSLSDEARIRSGSGAEGIDWRVPAQGEGVEELRALVGENREERTEISLSGPRLSELEPSLFTMLYSGLAHADAEIELKGHTLDRLGLRPRHARGLIDLPGALGALGFAPVGSEAGEIRAVVDGLLVEPRPTKALFPYLVAVATHPGLATDLSMRRVVDNQAWQELVDLVRAHQVDALKVFVDEAFPAKAKPDCDLDPDAAQVARACLGHCIDARPPSPGASDSMTSSGAQGPIALPADLVDHLATLPLFTTIDDGRVSLRMIQGWRAEQQELAYASFSLERLCLDGELVHRELGDPSRILRLSWPMSSVEGRPLVRLFDGRLRDVGQALRRFPRDEARLKERLGRV